MKKILTISQIQLPRLIGSLVGGMIGLTIVFFLMKQNEIDLVFFLSPLIFSYPSFEFAVSCNTSRRQLAKIVIGSVFLTSIIMLGIVLLYTFIFKYQFVIAGSNVTGPIDYLYFYFLILTAQLTSLVINMDSRLGYWSKSRRRGMEAIAFVSTVAVVLIHSILSAIFNPIVLGIMISFLFFIIIRFLILKFAELVKAVDFTEDVQPKSSWINTNQEE